MNVEGRKGTKQGKIPEWEAELWSYVSSGDGISCPIYNYCQSRLGGGWCRSDNLDYIAQLLDDRQFSATKYDLVSKGGKCGRIFQLVERQAQKYLKIARVQCPPVSTELISLADERRSIEVRLVPLRNYRGAIWYLNDRWIIQLNENDTLRRRRFALFHEAFHILAHLKATPVFKKSECGAGSFNELLADYFAGAILMPREWVKDKWAEVKDVGRMEQIFDVPRALMWFRLREIGLV